MRVDWLVTEMNILGGAEMFIRIAAPRLHALGWDLRLITLASGGSLVDHLRTESIPVIELGVNKTNSIYKITKILSIWNKDKPRILHTHLYHAGLIGRILGKMAGIDPILVQQAGPELFRSTFRSSLDKSTSSLVTQYIVTSEFVKQTLQNREKIPSEKITAIPNGIITHQYDLPRAKPENWPDIPQCPVLGTVARLAPEKGHLLFLDALSILSQNGVVFHAMMVGDGILKDELLQKTKNLHLEDQISWVGSQTNVPDWLSYFDIFVLPSHWEGISLALLEAMAAGLPVVATSVGGTPEVLKNGVSGILVPPSDPQSLAAAIHKLIESTSLRKEMGQAGKIHCQQNYDIDVIIKEIDFLYRRFTS